MAVRCAILGMVLITTSTAYAQVEVSTLPGVSYVDLFGYEVDIDGDVALCAAPFDWLPGLIEYAGSVAVFRRTTAGWGLDAILTASDAAENDRFGACVAHSNNRVVVGGAVDQVYSFRFDGVSWSETQILGPIPALSSGGFGRGLDVAGNTLVIGSMFESDAAFASGAVYFYTSVLGNWVLDQKLSMPSPFGFDFLGRDVAISQDGNVVVAGAAPTDEALSSMLPGSAHVYRRVGGVW
ncbi:MAG: hypothetical protein KDC38_18490, partial [Planctomycetes bacterium]|nr:hypothetical protein [Planctomycetota bacterium]